MDGFAPPRLRFGRSWVDSYSENCEESENPHQNLPPPFLKKQKINKKFFPENQQISRPPARTFDSGIWWFFLKYSGNVLLIFWFFKIRGGLWCGFSDSSQFSDSESTQDRPNRSLGGPKPSTLWKKVVGGSQEAVPRLLVEGNKTVGPPRLRFGW